MKDKNWEIFKLKRKKVGRDKIAKKLKIPAWYVQSLMTIWNQSWEHTLILVIGDLHIGSKDLDYQNFKINFIKNTTLLLNEVVANTKINEVILINLGDDIDNVIHNSQLEQNETMQDSLMMLQDFLQNVIELLEPDIIYYCWGNHDRLNKHFPTIHHLTDIVYENISTKYNLPIINLRFGQKIKIKDWNIFVAHNLGIKTLSNEISGLAVNRKINQIRNLYDVYRGVNVEKTEIFLTGHLHRFGIYYADGLVIFNGTTHRKTFHKINTKPEDVCQLLICLPEKSKCINKNGQLNLTLGKIYPIWLEKGGYYE